MAAHLVCLTFDFDALSNWIRREMTTPTPISQGEFGVVGTERILGLLRRHEIAATWFIPGHTLETYPAICARIHAAGHEIGHHGYLHEPPATLSRDREEAVLLRGSAAIRRITGSDPRGYRSPSWDLSPHSVELLLAHGHVPPGSHRPRAPDAGPGPTCQGADGDGRQVQPNGQRRRRVHRSRSGGLA